MDNTGYASARCVHSFNQRAREEHKYTKREERKGTRAEQLPVLVEHVGAIAHASNPESAAQWQRRRTLRLRIQFCICHRGRTLRGPLVQQEAAPHAERFHRTRQHRVDGCRRWRGGSQEVGQRELTHERDAAVRRFRRVGRHRSGRQALVVREQLTDRPVLVRRVARFTQRRIVVYLNRITYQKVENKQKNTGKESRNKRVKIKQDEYAV